MWDGDKRMKLQGKLQDKVAVITGGGTGIGRGIALAFAREGARVVVAGRRREPLETVAGEIVAAGGSAIALVCDVSQAADVSRLVESAVSEWGGLDVVVNNAAHWMAGNIEDTSEEDWEKVMNTNLKGVFLVSRASIPHLRKHGGAIVNIGSIASMVAMKNRAAYATSKGGLLQLSKSMALDHAEDRIRVNCICPGLVKTPLADHALSVHEDPEAEMARRAAEIPLGRIGTPEDIAELAVFLASEESSWMTGAAIPVDGGFTAQ